MQQAGREQIEGLRIRLQELKHFEQPDLDRLRAAELNQRQVNNLLTSTGEGVPMHVLAILADLENNRLDTPDLVRRMQDILAELDRVGREHLPEIGRELTSAIKTAEISLTDSPRPRGRGDGRICRNRPVRSRSGFGRQAAGAGRRGVGKAACRS